MYTQYVCVSVAVSAQFSARVDTLKPNEVTPEVGKVSGARADCICLHFSGDSQLFCITIGYEKKRKTYHQTTHIFGYLTSCTEVNS